MSDFLSTLAARTLGTLPVVAPRRRARFEPDTLSEAASFEQENGQTPSAIRRSAESAFASRPQPEAATSTPDNSPPSRPRATPPTVSASGIRLAPASSARSESIETPTPITAASIGLRSKPDATSDLPSTAHPATAGSLTPRTRPRLAISPAPTTPAAAPAIHVSIGRVEVRAIHRAEKPSTPPASPTSPRTSLGAYLRSRAPRE